MTRQSAAAEVRVDRAELVKVLKQLVRLARKGTREKAVIFLEDGKLRIGTSGLQVEIAAQGNWPGQARTMVAKLATFAETTLKHEEVVIKVAAGMLYFDDQGTSCIWSAAERPKPWLTIDPPTWEVLGLALKYGMAEVEALGLTSLVESAEYSRGRLVGRAARLLAPLAVKKEDVRAMVDACIARASRNIGCMDDGHDVDGKSAEPFGSP